MATTRVKFALDLVTADGKSHKGGASAAIDADEARDLVHRGMVQYETPEKTPDLPPVDDSKGGK